MLGISRDISGLLGRVRNFDARIRVVDPGTKATSAGTGWYPSWCFVYRINSGFKRCNFFGHRIEKEEYHSKEEVSEDPKSIFQEMHRKVEALTSKEKRCFSGSTAKKQLFVVFLDQQLLAKSLRVDWLYTAIKLNVTFFWRRVGERYFLSF